jgi:nucleoside-diphosphate-sugar epimerase
MASGRVLITGRYGFTGDYVAREMDAAGWEVWGAGLSPAPHVDNQYLQADLTERESLLQVLAQCRPDAVIHLAAVASVDHGRVEDFYQVNVIATRLLLGALAETGYGKAGVILASSANIYGNTPQSPIGEETPPAPVNDYAVSKLAMEHVTRLFEHRLPLVVTRPFNYTGRGQDTRFLIPKIVAHFRDRAAVIELGNVDVARDFSDVRDVAIAYRKLLLEGPRGKTINICSGQATSLQDILSICQDITGHEIEVQINPDFVRANEIAILTGDRSRLDQIWPDASRHTLRQTLDWMLSA